MQNVQTIRSEPEQEERDLVYHAPYNKELLQNQFHFDKTRIGLKSERNALYNRLHNVNKWGAPRKIQLKQSLSYELQRHISILDLPLQVYDVFHHAFRFYEQIPFNTKYRASRYIAPVIIYIECLERLIAINRKELISSLRCSYMDFNHLLKFYYRKNEDLYKKHKSDAFRKRWCFMWLSGIKSQFNLNDGFLFFANELLYSEFAILKNKKTTVIVALITEAVKRLMNRHDFYISPVCSFLGIVPAVISNNQQLIKTLTEGSELIKCYQKTRKN